MSTTDEARKTRDDARELVRTLPQTTRDYTLALDAFERAVRALTLAELRGEPSAELAEATAFAVKHVKGCGDNSCQFVRPYGVGTNGGCRCFDGRGAHQPGAIPALAKLFKASKAIAELQAKTGGTELRGEPSAELADCERMARKPGNAWCALVVEIDRLRALVADLQDDLAITQSREREKLDFLAAGRRTDCICIWCQERLAKYGGAK